MCLKMYLFGQFKLIANNTSIELPSRSAQSLLAFLALNAGVVQRREKLASLIWPEANEKNARSYLRQALWRIRKSFEAKELNWQEYLDVSDIEVVFKEDSGCWLDADVFLDNGGEEPTQQMIERISLYRGELLPGFFDEWIMIERDRFQAAYHQKMSLLLETFLHAGDWADAVKWSEDWIRLGYSPEPAYRVLMRAYAGMGDQGMVSATYQRCIEALDRELGLDPSPETQKLYTQICCGELDVPVAAPKVAPKKPVRIPNFLSGVFPEDLETQTFVAREHELAQLDRFLSQVISGQGRVVFVTGEAGSGKTALLNEFSSQAQRAHANLIVATGNCNAHTGLGDPYLPFREILELLTGDVEARWSAGAITRSQAMALWNLMPVSVNALVNAGPELVGTFIAGGGLAERATISAQGSEDWFSPLETLIADQRFDSAIGNLVQSDLFEQYTRVMRAIALEAPLVLILDDLQWADLGSISLLFHLSAHIKGSKILVVGSYRPVEVAIGRGGERHPLAPVVSEIQRRYGNFELNLDRAGTRDFVEAMVDSEPNRLGVPFRDMLFRQTRGHPLYLVELLRGLQERNDIVQDEIGCWVEGPALDWETIPARMEAVIKERVERLPPLLQRAMRVASVEGEVFTIEVLAQVLAVDEQELLNQLSEELDRKHRLVRAQSIQRVNDQYISTYRFRHIQTQKYLYNSLNQIERVRLHEQVGETLEKLHRVEELGEDLMEISLALTPAVQLARHFQEAGITSKAVNYLHIAGLRAVFLSGYQEAISHMRKGLSLLETLPDTLENKKQALSLQLSLGKSMKGATSVALPEVEMIFMRALGLCQQVGEPMQMWSILGELAIVYYVRGEYVQARKYAEDSLRFAFELGKPIVIALSHWIVGLILFALGEFNVSRNNFAKMTEFYDPDEHFRPFVYLRGVDAGLSAMAYEACCLWCLGYPEQAMQKSEQVLNLAKHKNHPFTLADVLTYAGCVFCEFTGDAAQLKEHADHLVDLSESTGLSWLATGIRYKGEALALLGQVEEGYAEAMKGVYEEYSFYSECFVVGVLGKIGNAFAEAGDLKKGRALIESAFEISERKQEYYCLAELYRMRGELCRLEGHEDKAESCFHKGIEVARQQEAKSWELRTTLSLTRLWQKQGRKKEARQALAEVYEWFTEGFDTPDLVAAKSLLAELA